MTLHIPSNSNPYDFPNIVKPPLPGFIRGDGWSLECLAYLFTDVDAGSRTSHLPIRAVKYLWDPWVCEFEPMQGYK